MSSVNGAVAPVVTKQSFELGVHLQVSAMVSVMDETTMYGDFGYQ
jgi:hypothetical protein